MKGQKIEKDFLQEGEELVLVKDKKAFNLDFIFIVLILYLHLEEAPGKPYQKDTINEEVIIRNGKRQSIGTVILDARRWKI